jgi:probable F420-dependent oxidoreductase
MTEAVGEVADGFFVHPFHTREFVQETTLPALERGLARAGRTRDELTISCQLLLVTGENDEQFLAARNGARAQISFYGSTPAYRPVLSCHGQSELGDELHQLSKQGKWLEMAGLIDDDLLEKIAVVAPRNEIARRVRERCADFADRVSFVAPFAPDPESWADVVAEVSAD